MTRLSTAEDRVAGAAAAAVGAAAAGAAAAGEAGIADIAAAAAAAAAAAGEADIADIAAAAGGTAVDLPVEGNSSLRVAEHSRVRAVGAAVAARVRMAVEGAEDVADAVAVADADAYVDDLARVGTPQSVQSERDRPAAEDSRGRLMFRACAACAVEGRRWRRYEWAALRIPCRAVGCARGGQAYSLGWCLDLLPGRPQADTPAPSSAMPHHGSSCSSNPLKTGEMKFVSKSVDSFLNFDTRITPLSIFGSGVALNTVLMTKDKSKVIFYKI
jgi:hypothetical protein